MKNIKKLSTLFIAAATVMSPVYTYADTLSDAVETKNAAKDNLENTSNKINSIKEKQKLLKEKIKKLDEDLFDLLVDIDILEDEIIEKQEQIKETEKKKDEAQADMDRQYASMKLRIQYMYENNGLSEGVEVTEQITGNDTISPLLNRSMFSGDIYKYDRNQLNIYEQAKNKAMLLAAELKEEQEDLTEKENSLKEQKEELQKKIEKKKRSSKNFAKQLEKSKALAKEYKETIKEQNKIIKEEMKRIKAEEAASSSLSGISNNYNANYSASGSGTGTEIANFALQFVGNPYVWGGNSLTNGIDCSGFVKAVYAHFGYSLPRTSKAQRSAGRAVSFSELQPGDIVCYSGHVAIYIGGGRIVHASSPSTGIKVSNNIYYRTVFGFRRII